MTAKQSVGQVASDLSEPGGVGEAVVSYIPAARAVEPTKPCKVCGYPMPVDVKQCQQSKCGAFQDGFRRRLVAIAPFQNLLLIMAGILGIVFNSQLQSFLLKTFWEPKIAIRLVANDTGTLMAVVRNTGVNAAEIVGLRLWTEKVGEPPEVLRYKGDLAKLTYPANLVPPGQVWREGTFEPRGSDENLFTQTGDGCTINLQVAYRESGLFSSPQEKLQRGEAKCPASPT